MELEKLLNESLNIDDDLNKKFRKCIEQVFSPIYLKKIDRVFKSPIQIKRFDKKTNIMAMTINNNIFINSEMFDTLDDNRKMVYLIHELFHVLQKKSQFKDLVVLNSLLKARTLKYINEKDINEFLTGKKQNIHSNYKEEFLSYCSNFAFNWSLAPELKNEYFDILKKSGCFNMSSKWWEDRFK